MLWAAGSVAATLLTFGYLERATRECALPDGGLGVEQVKERILGPLYTGRGSGQYQPIDAAAFDDFASIASRLARGDTCVAGLAERNGYEAVIAHDEVNARDVIVVWEPEGRIYGGALVVAIDDGARPVVFEAPHSKYDSGSAVGAMAMFVSLRARAIMFNTAHRCSSDAYSPCSGQAPVCGTREKYRASDAAHAVDSPFQAWHQAFLDADPTLVAVQLHGFGRKDEQQRHAYVSDGTELFAGPEWLSNRLARALDGDLPTGAASCNDPADADIRRYCAVVNPQGRYANGSPSPCDRAPTESTGRWVHLEQSTDLRRAHRDAVRDALDEVLPR